MHVRQTCFFFAIVCCFHLVRCRTHKESSQSRRWASWRPPKCADLKCSFRDATPKHSAVSRMYWWGFAWWPSDVWTFVMEFVADWVRVLCSQTCRNRQQMRHTAVSQLNSLLSQETPSLCPIVESLCFTFRLQSLNLFFQTTWLSFQGFPATGHTCDVFAPDLSSSVQFCFFKPKETEEELNGSHRSSELCHRSYVLFATDCSQTADKTRTSIPFEERF